MRTVTRRVKTLTGGARRSLTGATVSAAGIGVAIRIDELSDRTLARSAGPARPASRVTSATARFASFAHLELSPRRDGVMARPSGCPEALEAVKMEVFERDNAGNCWR